MRSRASPMSRRAGLLGLAGLLAACAGCGPLAPNGITPVGPLAAPPQPAEVVALAASMSPEGKDVFYTARPKLVDRAQMAVECPDDEDEGGSVLGCYGDGRIFILRVTRPELAGIMEVTAAHEMLHAVYDHLPPSERLRVEGSVEDLFQSAGDPRLEGSLAAYEGLDPDDRLDELHSIVGTEATVLSPALNDHYGRFFTTRQRVVEANARIEDTFEALERQIDGLTAETDRLEATLLTLEARLEAEEAQLESLDRRLDDRQAAGDRAGYNRIIPERNRLASSLEKGIDEYNELVNDYNAKVDQIDALALEQDKLVDALDQKAPAGP